MKKFLEKIESISTKVFKQLSGLNEQYFQTALGIEFRKQKKLMSRKKIKNS